MAAHRAARAGRDFLRNSAGTPCASPAQATSRRAPLPPAPAATAGPAPPRPAGSGQRACFVSAVKTRGLLGVKPPCPAGARAGGDHAAGHVTARRRRSPERSAGRALGPAGPATRHRPLAARAQRLTGAGEDVRDRGRGDPPRGQHQGRGGDLRLPHRSTPQYRERGSAHRFLPRTLSPQARAE